MKKQLTFLVVVLWSMLFTAAQGWSQLEIGPGPLPPWHADSQVQLGWVFDDPITPDASMPLPGWDRFIGTLPVWDYDPGRQTWENPAQWYTRIENFVNENPVKHMWISWVYLFDPLISAPRAYTNIDWFPGEGGYENDNANEEWFDSAGNPTTDHLQAVYARITLNIDLYPNPHYEDIWLGTAVPAGAMKVLEVYVQTLCVEACEGNFDADGNVDGSDLALFSADFGRTDCTTAPSCEGDFDGDNDVDGSNLAVFSADFGRTDCPTLLQD